MTGSKLHLFRNTKLSFASAKTASLIILVMNGQLWFSLNGMRYCVKNSILCGGGRSPGDVKLRRGTFVELGLKEVTRTEHEREQREILGWDIETGKE